mmetsp:Transcript_78675/g.156431  ORF Transcript_78675/g.156431 Transcript_78675/m.156431 type:complete len:299 (-) Transcript_78675:567-1463(-)
MAAHSAAQEGVSPSFICPLTLEIMVDPVTAADGHSYEHEAIAKWLQTSSLSPLTGERLPNKHLTRSHALRNAIQEHDQAQAAAKRRAATRQPTGVKVILLGDSNVGKTSLVHRIKENTFSASASQPTIGCSFCTHTVMSPSGERLTCAIWDTAGQEKYRSFTRQYFRGAQAALVLYDITSAASFEGVQRWLSELEAELAVGGGNGCALILVGSKVDRHEERQVPIEDARELARAKGAEHIECSSKEGTNCAAIFETAARLMLERGLAHDEGGMRSSALVSQQHATPAGGRIASAGCCT